MTTYEVGKKLVELCRAGKFEEAISSLYDKDIVSVEAAAMPGQPAEVRGLDAVIQKTKKWNESNTVHGFECSEPYPHGDKFAVWMKIDVTNKQMGRMIAEEIALYHVKDGRIVREEFMYHMDC